MKRLNSHGVYLFGVRADDSTLTSRPIRVRHEVLGFLLVLNGVEASAVWHVLLPEERYSLLVGAAWHGSSLLSWFLRAKVLLALGTAVGYAASSPEVRKRAHPRNEFVKGLVLACSSALSIAISALLARVSRRAFIGWDSMAACDAALTMSLCLLPSFGYRKLAATVGVCWSLWASLLLVGFAEGWDPVAPALACLAFFANIVIACKYGSFRSREELAGMFASESGSAELLQRKRHLRQDDTSALEEQLGENLLLLRHLRENLVASLGVGEAVAASGESVTGRLDRIIDGLERYRANILLDSMKHYMSSMDEFELPNSTTASFPLHTGRRPNSPRASSSSISSSASNWTSVSHSSNRALLESEMAGSALDMLSLLKTKQRSWRIGRRETFSGSRNSSGLSATLLRYSDSDPAPSRNSPRAHKRSISQLPQSLPCLTAVEPRQQLSDLGPAPSERHDLLEENEEENEDVRSRGSDAASPNVQSPPSSSETSHAATIINCRDSAPCNQRYSEENAENVEENGPVTDSSLEGDEPDNAEVGGQVVAIATGGNKLRRRRRPSMGAAMDDMCLPRGSGFDKRQQRELHFKYLQRKSIPTSSSKGKESLSASDAGNPLEQHRPAAYASSSLSSQSFSGASSFSKETVVTVARSSSLSFGTAAVVEPKIFYTGVKKRAPIETEDKEDSSGGTVEHSLAGEGAARFDGLDTDGEESGSDSCSDNEYDDDGPKSNAGEEDDSGSSDEENSHAAVRSVRNRRPSASSKLLARCEERSMYLRRLALEWSFGPGGIFARLEDPQVPETFRANPLTTLFLETMEHFGCLSGLNINKRTVARCMECIESKYLAWEQVEYHNSLHATDVLQSAACLVNVEAIRLSLQDTDLSVFALLFSAAIHDVAHPGRNEAFQVKTKSKLSTLYSDRSVLEHHHLAVAFSVIRANPKLDFLSQLDSTDASLFREKVIVVVLATDLAFHKKHFAKLVELTSSTRPLSRATSHSAIQTESNVDLVSNAEDNNVVLCSLIHFSDISNVSKDWDVYKKWIPCIFEEFFAQGDEERERGFHVGPVHDRQNCQPCEMQLIFIDLFVNEYLALLSIWSPEIGTLARSTLEENKKLLERHQSAEIGDISSLPRD